MSRVLLAVLVLALPASAPGVLVPYEASDGTRGTARGNNLVDVSPTGACSFTIVAGNVNLTGCRDRVGVACPIGEPCDLDRVPAGRCTLGLNAPCIWPAGAGFCTADPNVGCLVNADCTSHGLGGTCDTSTLVAACACQGTDDTLVSFETNALRCGGSGGVCSDGDSEFSYAPSLSAGLCSFTNVAGGPPTNCGREAGQDWTGARSPFHNPPLTPSVQREPGLGNAGAGPIVELRATHVYDVGAAEPGRGGVRRFSLLADSYWTDVPWSSGGVTNPGVHSHTWTLLCDTPAGWSTDDLLPNGQTCWNSTQNSIGYLWTQNINAADPLLNPPSLDVDMNGVPDCPPHCGVNYDLNTLEQLALEAVLRLDARAGTQLALESYVDSPAAQGDYLAVSSVVRHVWLPALDQRCFMGGDPQAICSTCVDGPDGDALPDRCSGNTDLSCSSNRDCQLYTGRCSDSEQPCNPAGGGTACPGAQICRSCVGRYAEGRCVGAPAVACRVDGDCASNNCGDENGSDIYPEPLARNPLAIPVGYNTYGFRELELETRCSPTRPGRIGLLTNFASALVLPQAILSTTGKASAEVRDPDLGGPAAPQDNARLGLARGRCNGDASVRCSTNNSCLFFGGICNNAPVVGIANAANTGPLSGGSYPSGLVFPVDPSGAACCTATGNVTNTLDKSTGVVRPLITPNGGAITWLQGNAAEADFTVGSGTAGPALLRSSGWGGGANRTPGCPGDSSSVDSLGAFPDPGPCNDPLGAVASGLCAGSDCEGNSGLDDVRTVATIGGVPSIPAIVGREKVPNPSASGTAAPTLYSVANLTGIDVSVLASQDTDFSETIESRICPMIGDCSQAGIQDCIRDSDCGGGNSCLNRVKRCIFPSLFPCEGDCDGIPDDIDNCPTVANPSQANFDMDGPGDACDSCETVVNANSDTDMDGVDQACDTCLNQVNAPLAAAPTTNRTLLSHQRDDDADGRGNRCDFDYNNAGVSLTAGDFNDMKFSLLPSPGLMTANTCGGLVAGEGGSGATQQCGEFDHDGVGTTVTASDFNLTKAAVAAGGVINTNFPKCTACTVGTGWSNTIGTGGERVGRPVCQTAVAGRCVFAP